MSISEFELQVLICAFYIRDPWDIKKLPRIYTDLHAGDFSEVAEQVMMLKQYGLSRMNPMAFAMDMSSGISAERNALIKKQIPETTYGTGLSFIMYYWMNAGVFPQLPNSYRKLKKNKVETLLVSGMLDGRTYVSAAKEIAKSFISTSGI